MPNPPIVHDVDDTTSALQQKVAKLKNELVRAQNELLEKADQSTRVIQLQQENLAMGDELDALKAVITNNQATIHSGEKDLRNVKIELSSVKASHAELENLMEQKDVVIVEIAQKLQERIGHINKIETNLQTARTLLESKDAEIEKYNNF